MLSEKNKKGSAPLNGLEIEKVEFFKVPPRWLFLKLTTKNGIVGWGEPVVEGRADTVETAIREVIPYLKDHPANKIEDFWQTVYRGGFYRGGPVLMSALSGIDQALWDIKGKALGVPIYELLGGAVRDKMRIYGWIQGDSPEELANAASIRMANGFNALKMNVAKKLEWIDAPYKINEAAKRLEAVRNAIGEKNQIGIDFHGRVHKGMIKMMAKALEPYQPFFLEEVVLSENDEALSILQNYTSIPIATGERMYSRWDFKKVLHDGMVDIIQPDLSHAGGISEVKKIAAMAEAYDVALAPHCPLGPISLASALQIDFCCHNALIQETSLGIHYHDEIELVDYLVDPSVFKVQDGYVNILTRPGLGIEINESKVRKQAEIGHNWKNPIWRTEDGSITEW